MCNSLFYHSSIFPFQPSSFPLPRCEYERKHCIVLITFFSYTSGRIKKMKNVHKFIQSLHCCCCCWYGLSQCDVMGLRLGLYIMGDEMLLCGIWDEEQFRMWIISAQCFTCRWTVCEVSWISFQPSRFVPIQLCFDFHHPVPLFTSHWTTRGIL